MSSPRQSLQRNRLLAVLTPEDFAHLQPHLHPVQLNLKDIIVSPGAPIEHVHFIETGLASVIAVTSEGERAEVGHVGREGMSPLSAIHGVDRSPNLTLIQATGTALRMPVGALHDAFRASPTLHALLLRYAHAFLVQVEHAALANGRYSIQERLARWLLMCHDRLDTDDLPITHEFLALMLGVRRPGVTEAIHLLEGVQIVRGRRGHVQVLDRSRLEEVAGGCYGVPEREYERLVGPAQSR
jgi:CRP-like cAMP-binding protein